MEYHLIKKADIWDGKQEKDDADKEKPERVGAGVIIVHPKKMISSDGTVLLNKALMALTVLPRKVISSDGTLLSNIGGQRKKSVEYCPSLTGTDWYSWYMG